MRIIIKDGKIAATVTDEYVGPDESISAPDWFDANKMSDYVIVDGELVYPAADIVRRERHEKLASSDWTQLSDAPVDKNAWATYRQELRDITLQDGFPDNVIWPEKPV